MIIFLFFYFLPRGFHCGDDTRTINAIIGVTRHTQQHYCFCILLLSIHLQQHTNTCPFMLLCYLYCYSLETNFPVHENRPYLEAYDWKETWICLFVRVLFVCIFTISTLKYFILCCKNSLFFWWFVRRYHWLTISFFMKRFCGRK